MIASRKERVPARASRKLQDPRSYLVHRVLADARSALRAERLADSRKQKPQEIKALGRSGDGGTRIPAAILLPDGYGRRDAIDLIHLRLFHALQKLPRIGRHRFHISPLPFRVDRIESKRRLART